MADKVASLYADIGADTTKLEKGLRETKAALKTTEAEMKVTGAATDGLKTKADAAGKELDQLADKTRKVGNAQKGATAEGQKFNLMSEISNRNANLLTGSITNLTTELSTQIGVGAALVGSLFLVKQAFDFARQAALEFGDKKVTEQFTKMDTAIGSLKKTISEIPFAGRGVLTWLGDAAEGLGNVAKLGGVAIAMWERYVGVINDLEFVTRISNIADAEKIKLMQELSGEIDTVTKATDLLRAANRKNYDDYRNQLQSGYIQYAIERGAAAGVETGRAGQGPVMVGQSYNVNELKGMNEWFTPSVAGQVSHSPVGGGNITVNIPVNAGAFLGARDDALRLGQLLEPAIRQALSRIGK